MFIQHGCDSATKLPCRAKSFVVDEVRSELLVHHDSQGRMETAGAPSVAEAFCAWDPWKHQAALYTDVFAAAPALEGCYAWIKSAVCACFFPASSITIWPESGREGTQQLVIFLCQILGLMWVKRWQSQD